MKLNECWDIAEKQLSTIALFYKLTFELHEKDDDQLHFSVGGHCFSITPNQHEDYFSFDLCVWNQTRGGYYHPPEWVDTTLEQNTSIPRSVLKVFMFVLENEVKYLQNDIASEGLQDTIE